MLCLMVLAGCSGEKDKNPVTGENTQSQVEEKNGILSNNVNTVFDSYEIYCWTKTNGKRWYLNIPYLNEISLGNVHKLANGEKWWINLVLDLDRTNPDCTLDEAKEIILNNFFDGIKGTFKVDENGFVEKSTSYEEHSGMTTLKIEGFATDEEFENIGECWVYGYILLLGDNPFGILGITQTDKSDTAKSEIKFNIDNMVETFVLK